MADEALLASQRVWPGRLLASGYEFRFRELDVAFANLLNQPG
jgi:NAD dependent epimerase/dehydratase family enzyme